MTDTKNTINDIQRLKTQNRYLQSDELSSSETMDCELLALFTAIGLEKSISHNSRNITWSNETLRENIYARNHLVITDPYTSNIHIEIDQVSETYKSELTFDQMLQNCRNDPKNNECAGAPDKKYPITSYGCRKVDSKTNGKKQVTLPIFVTAEIKEEYQPKSGNRGSIPSEITENLDQMEKIGKDKKEEDQNGHILAYSLGGPTKIYNYIPMARTLNCSSFKKIENEIRRFVEKDKGNYVSWSFIAHYIESTYRPVGFFLQHTRHHSNGLVEPTSDVYCSNLADYKYKCYSRSDN